MNFLRLSISLSTNRPKGLQLLAGGCTKDAVINYAGKALSTDDGNVKTNIETVIGVCLDINKDLGTQLEEDAAMNDVISRMIKRNIDKAIDETNERVAKDMLKKNLPLSLIEEISKLSEDAIRNLAKSLGVAVMG